MKDKDQIIAIAHACGIRDIFDITGRGLVYGVDEGNRISEYKVPNYLRSLDAMASAERILTVEQQEKYCLHLGPLTTERAWRYITAPAYVRAEAFLRTIDKWIDDET